MPPRCLAGCECWRPREPCPAAFQKHAERLNGDSPSFPTRHNWHTGHMRTARVLATSAVLVAIGGCAAAVVGVAAPQPKSHGHERLDPLPTLTTRALPLSDLAVTSAAPRTSAAPSSTTPRPHPSSSSQHAAPTRPSSASPARPAPRTTATTPSAAPKPAPVRGGALPLGYDTGLVEHRDAPRLVADIAQRRAATVNGGWN